MSYIVWNCQGPGNQRVVQELADLVQAKARSLVFLAGTWADEARLNYVQSHIQSDKKFFVERINRGGGLMLFWTNEIEMDVESSSLNHIDVTINKNSEKPWRFTGFYSEPDTHKDSSLGIFFILYTAEALCHCFALMISMR